jgi:NADH dehydrogenase/NADH:ubiquinone oxidoreductase subunit G
VTLAGLDQAEKEGIFVNAKQRAQFFHAALSAPGEARNDLRILAELATLFGRRPVWSDAASVRAEMAAREDRLAALGAGIDPLGLRLDGAHRAEVSG